jgi:hypothetical protein
VLTTLFQRGDFTLNSGAESSWKLECDALTDEDWDGVAAMARVLVPHFSDVVGVPRGGLKLADRLKPFAVAGVGPQLVVDDVLTTGGSIGRLRAELILARGLAPYVVFPHDGKAHKTVVGVVLFARGPCPYWVKAICQLPEPFWITPRTRG